MKNQSELLKAITDTIGENDSISTPKVEVSLVDGVFNVYSEEHGKDIQVDYFSALAIKDILDKKLSGE